MEKRCSKIVEMSSNGLWKSILWKVFRSPFDDNGNGLSRYPKAHWKTIPKVFESL